VGHFDVKTATPKLSTARGLFYVYHRDVDEDPTTTGSPPRSSTRRATEIVYHTTVPSSCPSPKRVLLASMVAVVAAACSPYLHSPPARLVPLEAAKSLAKGDLAFQGALGGGTSVWRPGYIAGTFQTRYGFGQGFEGVAEASFVSLFPRDTDWNTDALHSMFAGRAGFKYEVASWFALQAGFGGGGSAAGGFVSPDAGGIFSYQGPKVVPFVAAGFYYSWPVRAKAIVFTDGDGDVAVLRPTNTLGYYGNFGIRVPFSHSDPESPRSALIIAYRFVGAAYEEQPFGRVHEIYHLGVFALDFVLRRDRSAGGRWRIR
jgi:hypothetical protein